METDMETTHRNTNNLDSYEFTLHASGWGTQGDRRGDASHRPSMRTSAHVTSQHLSRAQWRIDLGSRLLWGQVASQLNDLLPESAS